MADLPDDIIIQTTIEKDGQFRSPLEDSPELLQEIGRFIVLFNLIDHELLLQFYYVISQINDTYRPILDFLCSQQFLKKIDILKNMLGEELYKELFEINEFRNYMGHGIYGMNSSGEVSNTKRSRNGKYDIKTLTKEIVIEEINKEKKILNKFYQMRISKLKS